MDTERQIAVGGLRYFPAEDLQPNWWWLKPRLDIVARRSGARWIAEDVYAAVKAGTAQLFLVESGDAERLGFLVVGTSQDYDGKIFSVWVLHNGSEEDIISMWEADLTRIAQRSGAKRIVFTSARKGWGRRLAQFGYREAGRIYEKEL